MSPLESESRIAAQFAPFATVDSIPYFLKSPFSCAITIGEQSVSAIMPNFILLTSGASLTGSDPAQPLGSDPSNAPTAEYPASFRQKWRRVSEVNAADLGVANSAFVIADAFSRGHAKPSRGALQRDHPHHEPHS